MSAPDFLTSLLLAVGIATPISVLGCLAVKYRKRLSDWFRRPSTPAVSARGRRAADEPMNPADAQPGGRRGRLRLLIVAAAVAVLFNGAPWLLIGLNIARGGNASLCLCWNASYAGFLIAGLMDWQGEIVLQTGWALSFLLDVAVCYVAGRLLRMRWAIPALFSGLTAIHGLNLYVGLMWFRGHWG